MPSLDFDSGAADYKKLAEAVNHRVATAALKHVPQPKPGSRILDLACGTGVATSAVMDIVNAQSINPPPTVIGIDIAEGMIKLYQTKVNSEQWNTVSCRVQDCQNLQGFHDQEFQMVLMNFGIMFMPDAPRTVQEIYRVLKPGGHAVFTTWKENVLANLLARAALAVQAPPADLAPKDEWQTDEKLILTVHVGGFKMRNIQVFVEEEVWEGGSADGIVDSYSTPFWNVLKDGTEESNVKWRKAVRKQLTPEERESGSIDMIAWVCVAEKDF